MFKVLDSKGEIVADSEYRSIAMGLANLRAKENPGKVFSLQEPSEQITHTAFVPIVRYADNFDLVNYKINEDDLKRLVKFLDLMPMLRTTKPWFYYATIHGKIFESECIESQLVTQRICFEDLQEINLRWFQFNGNKISVAFPHI